VRIVAVVMIYKSFFRKILTQHCILAVRHSSKLPLTHSLKTARRAEKHTKLKRGQLNNYKSYRKKLNYTVIADNIVNILKVELCLLAERMLTL